MRARNLKPGFFKNEDLAEISFEARILFAGLWCFSDREGRFEWRPKKIKAEIFPYDNVKVEVLLGALLDKKFIVKYEVEGQEYGWVQTFLEHQNPHPHEAQSKIPEYVEQNQCHGVSVTSNRQVSDMSETRQEVAGLNPSSLNPSSLNPESLSTPPTHTRLQPNEVIFLFNETVQYLPKASKTKSRENKIRTRLKEHPDINWWKVVFEKADNILITHRDGRQDWFPTFDWLMDNDKNAVKVFEGNYDDSKRPKKEIKYESPYGIYEDGKKVL